MTEFSKTLVEILNMITAVVFAWCVLPNHYHVLLQTDNLIFLIKEIGKLHGRSSYQWNSEEDCRGRKVWFNCVDRYIRGERHFCATMNYIHHNPVHHNYVTKWQEWPFSSVTEYLEHVGEQRAVEIWKNYPILDYGKGWDDTDM
jgi:putative transposase